MIMAVSQREKADVQYSFQNCVPKIIIIVNLSHWGRVRESRGPRINLWVVFCVVWCGYSILP